MKDKKVFTLAETQKNISLATYRGRGIKGEGVIKHAAFTLAETLIVLVILGVIASITIPAVIRNQIEAQNRTRIKKAMTVYDTAINKIVVENGIKSNDALYSSNSNDKIAFAPQDNCTRSSAYFKINRTLSDDNGTNCRFCSSDNVCWDISNILKPIIGIGEEGITNENSTNRYRMFAHFGDNGELRVDDVAYEQNHDYLTDDEKEELTALYNFTNNKKSSGGGEDKQKSPFDECKEKGQNTCIVDGVPYDYVPVTSKECIDITGGAYGMKSGTQSCVEESFYVHDFGLPAEYESLAYDYTGSTCYVCMDYNQHDYYNAAKLFCKSKGLRLITLGELNATSYKNSGCYFAEEEDFNDMTYGMCYGGLSAMGKMMDFSILCVAD